MDRIEKINRNYIQSDKWIKNIKSAATIPELAEQLMLRFKSPGTYGPYISWSAYAEVELPADVVIDLVDASQLDIDEVEKACLLILDKVVKNEQLSQISLRPAKEEYDIIHNTCELIRTLNLVSCYKSLSNYLISEYENEKIPVRGRSECYKVGLEALAVIQPNDLDYLRFWMPIWSSDRPGLWYYAMLGLIEQSPRIALDHIPFMIGRKIDRSGRLLRKLWEKPLVKANMESTIFAGLVANQEWAGHALNLLGSDLLEKDRTTLIQNLFDIKKNTYEISEINE